jgi:hypothetical protein
MRWPKVSAGEGTESFVSLGPYICGEIFCFFDFVLIVSLSSKVGSDDLDQIIVPD